MPLNYVEFDFLEKVGEEKKPPRRLRYTVTTAHALDERAGVGIGELMSRRQNVHAMVLMTCYALQYSDASMTEKRAEALVQRFIDRQGDTGELFKALVKAANRSGVYGKPDEDDEEEEDAPAPNATSAAASPEPRPGVDDRA